MGRMTKQLLQPQIQIWRRIWRIKICRRIRRRRRGHPARGM
jgi:hypothetical protein